jgi:hypothetical protein
MYSSRLIELLGRNPFRPWPVGEDLFPNDRAWHIDRPADRPGCFQDIVHRLHHYPAIMNEGEDTWVASVSERAQVTVNIY